MQIAEIRAGLDPRADHSSGRRERLFAEQINEFRRLLGSAELAGQEPGPASGASCPIAGPGNAIAPLVDPGSHERANFSPGEPGPLARADAAKETEDLPLPDSEAPLLDPLELAMATPLGSLPPNTRDLGPSVASLLDPLVAELVRSIAWGGDRRRGAARLELGGKRFGGASVVVHADGKAIALEIAAPAHADAHELGERLRERFEARGLTVRTVTLV